MDKRIYTALAVLLAIGIGFYLWNQAQQSQIQEVNSNLIANLTTELSSAKTIEDSIAILEKYNSIVQLHPYNRQLTGKTKSVFEMLPQLKLKEAENKIRDLEKAVKRKPAGALVNIPPPIIDDPEIVDDFGLEEPQPVSNKASEIVLRKLICNKQQELWGDDRIQIKCNGQVLIDERRMQAGDEIDLTEFEAFHFKDGSMNITVLERDDDRTELNKNDIMLQVSISPKNSKKGFLSKTGQKFGGNYTLEYEIR